MNGGVVLSCAGLGFSDSLSAEVKPRILLMGLRRSGKSSIQKVVFHKMSPSDTLFLESTNKICREDVSSSSFVSFQIWDFPGQIDFFDPTFDYEMIFRGTGALIFVIDSQVRSHAHTPTRPHVHTSIVHCYVCRPATVRALPLRSETLSSPSLPVGAGRTTTWKP